MRKWLVIFILAGVIIILSFLLFLPDNSSSKYQTLQINNKKITVEIADTDGKRIQGLSGRDKLSSGKGMLFIFPTISYYQFWMKEMKFPLDFIWIGKNTVVDLTENVPIPTAQKDLQAFSAKVMFDRVLELNAGQIKSLNVKIGDTVYYE